MGFIKGKLNLTRYRVVEGPPEALTNEYVSERLIKNSFVDIENAPQEASLGWVEFMDHLSTNFDPAAFAFGDITAMTLRLDQRKVTNATINRYYAIAAAEYRERTGRMPNKVVKKELKESINASLLAKVPLTTEIIEVVWLRDKKEVWLGAVGEKNRELFEKLWRRTFGLSLQMLVPITKGLELLPGTMHNTLLGLKPYFNLTFREEGAAA